MSKLLWDQDGQRRYETGVNKGVLFPYSNNAYQKGVAWNGLTAVSENPSGAESTPLWADNIKYLNLISTEEFGATIEAYTYPNEFAACDGSAFLVPGVSIKQQKRSKFGFSYQTRIGNDVDGSDYGYMIHIVYGAQAAPSSKSYATINDSPEAITLSWELTTTPIEFPGMKPTAHVTIDSTQFVTADDKLKLKALEDMLYGTENSDPMLPTPDQLMSIFSNSPVVTPSVSVVPSRTAVDVGAKVTLFAYTIPNNSTVTWSTTDTAYISVDSSTGEVTGVAEGSGTVTATITVDGTNYTDTCTVAVNAVAG